MTRVIFSMAIRYEEQNVGSLNSRLTQCLKKGRMQGHYTHATHSWVSMAAGSMASTPSSHLLTYHMAAHLMFTSNAPKSETFILHRYTSPFLMVNMKIPSLQAA